MQNQTETNLNLARKWRSKSFDEIVGQDLSVKILRNSLYLNQFFPVYLFSGQRGCGKTSTARIFAAAVNCKNLSNFQKEPKNFELPCFKCESCIAMQNLKHPDFIEMDAASNTGVDNVRNIIETSSFMPILGQNKIYLIDEAHMLSKSAFNAFLKLLEEPPSTAMFILATTDPEKIPDTVRSRCFQLFFNAINLNSLLNHLKNICCIEKINFEESGLEVICKQSGGSARDAINLLEQVRFSSETVSREFVYAALGYPSDEQIFGLVEHLLEKESLSVFLVYLNEIKFDQISYDYIWKNIIEMLRNLIFYKNGIIAHNFNLSLLKININDIEESWIAELLQYFFDNELNFNRISNKKIFLEHLFVKILIGKTIYPVLQTTLDTPEGKHAIKIESVVKEVRVVDEQWQVFLNKLAVLDDPLINSVFKQAEFSKIDLEAKKIDIFFDKKFSFLMELLEDTRKNWTVILAEVFGKTLSLNAILKDNIISQVKVETKPQIAQQQPVQKVNTNTQQNFYKNKFEKKTNLGKAIDVSDKEKWQLSNALLETFPGKLIEIEEGKKDE